MSNKDIERFWSYVGKTSSCWNWAKYTNKGGYGVFSFKDFPRISSRVSWYLNFGKIPKDKLICHKCDNRKCVNPQHLFLGTYDDNAKDMIAKGRSATGTRNGTKTHPEKINPVRGEKNSRAKLTNKQAEEIRKEYALGNLTQYRLADIYKVRQNVINRIVNNKGYIKYETKKS